MSSHQSSPKSHPTLHHREDDQKEQKPLGSIKELQGFWSKSTPTKSKVSFRFSFKVWLGHAAERKNFLISSMNTSKGRSHQLFFRKFLRQFRIFNLSKIFWTLFSSKITRMNACIDSLSLIFTTHKTRRAHMAMIFDDGLWGKTMT